MSNRYVGIIANRIFDRMNNKRRQRVLVAPLDWGLGHATRCAPLIEALCAEGAEVILAADGRSYHWLKREFPDLKLIQLPGYSVSYPRSRYMAIHLLLQSPRILKKIYEERRLTEALVAEHDIDILISDNRFACRSAKTKNIYITHQLQVKAPMAGGMATRIHRKYYERFDEIWVPDDTGATNLSGDLGHAIQPSVPVKFIGPLSRFAYTGKAQVTALNLVLILLSGPEPQRSILEEILTAAYLPSQRNVVLVRGVTELRGVRQLREGFTVYDYLPTQDLLPLLRGAAYVVARPGYSTLCDLAAVGQKLVAIPTPGQTEQEYLAELHGKNHRLIAIAQDEFSLDAIPNDALLPHLEHAFDAGLLNKAVKELLATP